MASQYDIENISKMIQSYIVAYHSEASDEEDGDAIKTPTHAGIHPLTGLTP